MEEWLTHWLEDITAPFVKVNTVAGYRVAVNHHLIPGVGRHKLTELRAPINPRTDWGKWKRLLQDAGIRDGRLHDARHTAATVLLLLGVSERTMMGVMGWSNPAMAQRYAHMAEPIRRDIATRVGGLLWGDPPEFQPGS